jgi:hypothetical protein
MGDKITVFSSALHLLNAEADYGTESTLTAVVQNNSIPQSVMHTLLGGTASKIPLMCRYARNEYVLGLPAGSTAGTGFITDEDLADIIATDIGYAYDTTVLQKQDTPYLPSTFALTHLLANRAYNYETYGIGTYPPGVVFDPMSEYPIVYNTQMIVQSVILTDTSEVDIIYTMLSEVDVAGSREWVLNNNSPFIESLAEPVDARWDEPCLQVFYKKLDSVGTILPTVYSWVYFNNDGTYPDLDLEVSSLPEDEFLPVVPVRYNNVNYADASRAVETHPDYELYNTSKKLLDKIDLNFEELGSLIEENPDVAEIDHAYVMFGIDLQTDYNSSLLYLNNYFYYLYLLGDANYKASNPVIGWGQQPANGFVEYGLNLTLTHGLITVETINGIIGNGRVGQSRKSFTSYDVTTQTGEEAGDSGGTYYWTVTNTYYKLVLETQIAKNVIRKVIVDRPTVYNKIYNNYSVVTTLNDVVSDPDNHNFIIPLQYSMAQDLPMLYRNELYSDSALMIVNSMHREDQDWYNSGFFKFILLVVAVVITLVTGQAWVTALVAAIDAGVIALIIFISYTLIFGFFVEYSMQWLVEELGEEYAIIAAIAAVVVAVVTKNMTLMQKSIAALQMSTTQLIMQMSTALISAANEFMVEEGQEIVNDYMDFSDKLSDRYEDLDVTLDYLDRDMKVDWDPLTFIRPSQFQIAPNESPTNFFNRCFGLPNSSTYGIHKEIPDWVSNMVKVPTT